MQHKHEIQRGPWLHPALPFPPKPPTALGTVHISRGLSHPTPKAPTPLASPSIGLYNRGSCEGAGALRIWDKKSCDKFKRMTDTQVPLPSPGPSQAGVSQGRALGIFLDQ